MSRVLVIGGGIAGLGAALFLRKLGHEVILVEQSRGLGALVRGFSRGGLLFETGFHYAGGLGRGEVLYRYLDCLGLFKHGLQVLPLAPEGGEVLRFAGHQPDILVPSSFEDLRNMVPAGPEVNKFYSCARTVFEASPYLNLGSGSAGLSLGDYSRGATLADMLNFLPLEEHFKNLLGFRCLLYGVEPGEASFDEFSLVDYSYLNGSYTFQGGGEALVKAFEAELKAIGIELIVGHEVTAIKVNSNNAVVGATLQYHYGTKPDLEVAVEMCVHTASPTILPQLLPQGAIRPVLARRLATLRQTPSPFMIFGRTKSSGLAKKQLFLCPEGGLKNWLAPVNKGIYISGGFPHHDVSDAQGVRVGYWPVFATAMLTESEVKAYRGLSPDGSRPLFYTEFKEQLAEELRLRLLQHCPELGGDLEVVASATELTLNRYSFNCGSGIFGRLHGTSEAPITPITRVGGLALAGQNIVLPGLLGVLVSSAVAVGCLVGQREVLELLES